MNIKIKFELSLLVFACFTGICKAQVSTGMWLPYQAVSNEVFSKLKQDGIKLSKKDIYDINKNCVSKAVLSMSNDGGFAMPYATASFVSADGLVITNFHCVSRYIKEISNEENDYLKYGCWATSRSEEAPLFNLQLNQFLGCEDITDIVSKGLDTLDEKARASAMLKNAEAVAKRVEVKKNEVSRVYSLMGGQQYILAIYRILKDVRIVASPPMDLAMEGGDDVNWQWPRYSCDFAFLRVYANSDNEPVAYNTSNVPYHPIDYLKIAGNEVNSGDFVMVAGFPSKTQKHIPYFAMDKIIFSDTRLRMDICKAKLDYLHSCMDKAPEHLKSGYAERISKVNNVYLRSKGEISCAGKTHVVTFREQDDNALQQWINQNPERKKRYGETLIEDMKANYLNNVTKFNHMDEVFDCVVASGASIIPFAGKFEKLRNIDIANRKNRKEDMEDEIHGIRRTVEDFFSSVNIEEDCGMFKLLLPYYLKEMQPEYLDSIFLDNYDIDSLYKHSVITDKQRVTNFLDNAVEQGTDLLDNDLLYKMCIAFYVTRVQKVTRAATKCRRILLDYFKTYMRAYTEFNEGKQCDYDANHTLRLSPGKVFDKTQKKDVPVSCCFTANAQTCSGNSGSPVLNAKGELVGLNFDREMSGLSSIYRSNNVQARNICVNIQYVMWVIKNKSKSQYILNEIYSKK